MRARIFRCWRCRGKWRNRSRISCRRTPERRPGSTQSVWQIAVKVLVTAIVVVAVSELAKRSSLWAGLLASLPLTSLLAFIWTYLDTGNVEQVGTLSWNIFWLVLPSLLLFLLLPWLL